MTFRTKLGILAAVLLIATAICWIFFPGRDELSGTFGRIAIVATVVWVLMPETATAISLGWTAGVLLVGVFFMRLPTPARWGLILGSPIIVLLFWPHIRTIIRETRRQQASRPVRSNRGES